MSESPKHCLNCGSGGVEKFCPACGQKVTSPGISLADFAKDVYEIAVGLETPFWATLRGMLIHPGELTRAYIAGKRIRYFKPIQFFLVAIGFYFLIRTFFGFDPVDYIGPRDFDDAWFQRVNHFMSRNVNYVLPIWILILGVLDPWFFRESPNRVIERMTHYCFTIAEYVFFATLLIPIYTYLALPYITTYFLIFGYVGYSACSFHRQRSARAILKTGLFLFLSFAIYVACTFGAAFLILYLFDPPGTL